MLAYASSDLSVGVVSAKTLRVRYPRPSSSCRFLHLPRTARPRHPPGARVPSDDAQMVTERRPRRLCERRQLGPVHLDLGTSAQLCAEQFCPTLYCER
jgi:hypothetical protein